VILLLLAIAPRLVEFLYVVGVNGNRLCAKSRMASLERCSSRLTRGNDPEDRNVLSPSLSLSLSLSVAARNRLREDWELSRSLYQRSTQVSAFDERFRGQSAESRRRGRYEDTSQADGRFCYKSRVVKPTERAERHAFFISCSFRESQ